MLGGDAVTAAEQGADEGVWADLVGQRKVVATLRQAVAGGRHAMTHAWLITGPPGSGRSNAGRAFAAALQCREGGCGRCQACRTALSGAHPDVTLVRSDLHGVGDAIRLSRATLGKIRQNLFFAFVYNVLGIPLAAMGMLNPVVAGAAMAMSSVSVVSNSLLLKRWHPDKS